ncbi:MAG: DUF5666 domain-containing protein [Leptothrix sp. (in: b-proteobacteria)]
MSITTPTTARSGLQSTLQLGVIAIAAALAVACGGGGVGSNSTGSAGGFTSGTVTGFGSIIVNGARYDDSTATGSITGDDDSSVQASSIKLGMEVEIEHSGVFTCPADTTQLCKASASSISYGASLSGPVSANTAVLTGGLVTGGTLTLLGQTVVLTDATIFVGFGTTGFDSTYAGQVEVHGIFDNATGQLTATRVEAKSNLLAFRLRGLVSGLDTVKQTALIGNQTVSFKENLSAQFASLVSGAVVRVKLDPVKNTDGNWVATKLKTKKHEHVNGEHAELEGTVASLATEGKTFKVNGVTVDYSSTSLVYENGSAADLSVAGARVEVKGDFVNGTLVATKIEFKKPGDKLKGNLEYHVTVTAAIAPTATTFTATNSSGTSFTFDIGALVITPGIVAVGNSVEIKGYLAADGTTIVVKSVKSDSSSSSSPDDKKGKSS